MRLLACLAVAGAVLYLALCAVLFVFQRSLIYFPQHSAPGSPDNTLRLPVAGADVQVTVRAHAGPDALIYFGGNAEDVSLNLPAFSRAFPGHAIYLQHYRGYGGSTGAPTEESLAADALALFDRVHKQHAHVVVVGRSLGTGVATRLVSQRPAARLVLVTPYDSLQELAAQRFPWLPVHWLLQEKFESWRYVARIAIPTLLIAAEHDEVIPRASTEQLHARFAAGLATLVVLPGTSHNTVSEHPQYLGVIAGALSAQ